MKINDHTSKNCAVYRSKWRILMAAALIIALTAFTLLMTACSSEESSEDTGVMGNDSVSMDDSSGNQGAAGGDVENSYGAPETVETPDVPDVADDGLDWTGFPEVPYDSGLYDDDLDRTVAGTWAIPRGYGFIFTLDYGHTGHFEYVDMDNPDTEFDGPITWCIRNGYVAVRSDNVRVDMTVFEYDNANDVMYLYGDEWTTDHAFKRQ